MPRRTARQGFIFVAGIVISLQVGQASAMGLLQAYEAALQNDATYRSAIFDNQAGQENKILGRSNLLPNAQLNYSTAKNKADLTQPENFAGVVIPYTTHPDYTSTSSSVTVRQVLFSLDAYAKYKQGIAQTNFSDAQFTARRQDLIIRLVTAYAEAQYANDQVALISAQRNAFAEQRHINDRMFERGEGTKTDMLETQAKLDLSESQLIEAQDNLLTARNTLASMLGQSVEQLDGLTDNFRLLPSTVSTFDEWVALAIENNAEILAGKYNIEVAEQEVKKNWAGHTPRLDLQASYSRAKSDSLTTLDQDQTTKSIGLQLVIPLYSGGSVSALTRQAVANREKAKSDLDFTTKKILLELRKQYSAVMSSSAKIDALVKSVSSATLLVEATNQSVKGGVRINLDVLNAQQQLVTSKRDLVQTRYNYLLAYLRLRNAAGTLNGADLVDISHYFASTP
ncbi:TolC family outer membrane protein [Undibacterium sp. TJN25]|uniref:TolC family outer membrane protein n=1 Tax=Undibacterium sp. TJN25 TaxID=3413056 RepID=UPI003BF2E4CE